MLRQFVQRALRVPSGVRCVGRGPRDPEDRFMRQGQSQLSVLEKYMSAKQACEGKSYRSKVQ